MTQQTTNQPGSEPASPAPAPAPADPGTAAAPAAAGPAPAPAAPAPAQAPAAAPAAGDAGTAPAEYAAFTVAEGKTVDKAVSDRVVATAKELGLPQDKAQKLYEQSVADQAKQTSDIAAAIESWKTATNADPEIGGALAETAKVEMGVALTKVGNDKLVGLLKATGLENHPEVVRMFVKVGKLFKQDVAAATPNAGPASARKAAHEVMYDGK